MIEVRSDYSPASGRKFVRKLLALVELGIESPNVMNMYKEICRGLVTSLVTIQRINLNHLSLRLVTVL